MRLDYNDTESETQLQGLASRLLIEIGYITEVNKYNQATITLYKNKEVLKGVDLIFPSGLGEGGSANSDCLVFIPRTEYHPETGVNLSSPPFSLRGAKALPISMGVKDRVSVYNTNCSEFNICSEVFSLLFNSESISLLNNYTNVYIDDEGNLTITLNKGLIVLHITESLSRITYFNNDGIPYYQKDYSITDTTITEYFAGLSEVTETQRNDMSQYTDWTKTKTYNRDGTTSETINDQTFINSSYTNNSVSININGEDNSINITTGVTTIDIGSDGSISIKGDGDISVESGNAITLTTGNGTLGAMISELIQDINALVTVGSPASHTVDPSSQTKLTQFVNTWGQYFL